MEKVTDKNKAWVAGAGSLVTALVMWADTQYNLNLGPALIAGIGTVVTGFLTWFIPNIQRKIEA